MAALIVGSGREPGCIRRASRSVRYRRDVGHLWLLDLVITQVAHRQPLKWSWLWYACSLAWQRTASSVGDKVAAAGRFRCSPVALYILDGPASSSADLISADLLPSATFFHQLCPPEHSSAPTSWIDVPFPACAAFFVDSPRLQTGHRLTISPRLARRAPHPSPRLDYVGHPLQVALDVEHGTVRPVLLPDSSEPRFCWRRRTHGHCVQPRTFEPQRMTFSAAVKPTSGPAHSTAFSRPSPHAPLPLPSTARPSPGPRPTRAPNMRLFGPSEQTGSCDWSPRRAPWLSRHQQDDPAVPPQSASPLLRNADSTSDDDEWPCFHLLAARPGLHDVYFHTRSVPSVWACPTCDFRFGPAPTAPPIESASCN